MYFYSNVPAGMVFIHNYVNFKFCILDVHQNDQTNIMSSCNVIYVLPRDAKKVKNGLETYDFLDKCFRMVPKLIDISCDEVNENKSNNQIKVIAIPVTKGFNTWLQSNSDIKDNIVNGKGKSEIKINEHQGKEWTNLILKEGYELCPLSTFMLGNHKKSSELCISKQIINVIDRDSSENSSVSIKSLSTTKMLLLETALLYANSDAKMNSNDNIEKIIVLIKSLKGNACPKKLEKLGDDTLVIPSRAFLPSESSFQRVLGTVFPSELSKILDEDPNHDQKQEKKLAQDFKTMKLSESFVMENNSIIQTFMKSLWESLATSRNCHRVVRRGEIDPNSKIRKSGHAILWLSPVFLQSNQDRLNMIKNANKTDSEHKEMNQIQKKAKNLTLNDISLSPGWITINEQGIFQSFDLTQVMFSRGNISEKMRFGSSLVQNGDVVLDMYAGIGYFTLPALLSLDSKSSNKKEITNSKNMRNTESKISLKGKGKAKFVYACEWNVNALKALEYNLRQNGVSENRYMLLEGDCRITLGQMEKNKTGLFCDVDILDKNDDNRAKVGPLGSGVDRVSLGLLPSSEGGWEMAVKCLRKDVGGWLHIHGNVAVTEKYSWSMWVCKKLQTYANEKEKIRWDDDFCSGNDNLVSSQDWYVICNHVEHVKSFAPKVDHLVADIFVGPLCVWKGQKVNQSTILRKDLENRFSGVIDPDGLFHPCPKHVETPSCALSRSGILHQEWMMA